MSTLVLLLAAPLLLALLLWMVPPRWPRAVSIAAFLIAVALALLAATLDLQPRAPEMTLFSSDGGLLLGGPGTFTGGMRQMVVLLYTGVAVLFLASVRWPQGPNFVPAGLASLSPFLFALLVDDLAYGAAAILLAIGLLSAMTADSRRRTGPAAWRFFLLSALAMPLLLLASWLLDSQQLALGEAAWRLVFLGAIALLGGFPFHIWVRRMVAGAPALAALFIVGPAQLAILTFVWRWLVQYSQFLSATPLSAALGWVGTLNVLVGAVYALKAEQPRDLLGSLVVVDMGAVLICLAVQSIAQAWTLVLFRLMGLLLATAAVQWLEGRSASGDWAGRELLRRDPVATSLFAYGALSLAGVPLSPGFAARWAAATVGSAGSVWWGLFQALAVAAGAVGVLRILAPIAVDVPNGLRSRLAPTSTRRSWQAAVLALCLLVALYLSIAPWPFLRFVSALSAQF